MVKPGGTGSARLLISARLAPLPPSRFFMSARPSALPPPKPYTHFTISHLPFDLREMGDLVERVADAGQEPQPVRTQVPIVAINGYAGKKFIDRTAQNSQRRHRLDKGLALQRRGAARAGLLERGGQGGFGRLGQELWLRRLGIGAAVLFLLDAHGVDRDLHAFPTRRSSEGRSVLS